MRTFIAIPLDDNTHTQLNKLQARLRVSNADIKWVEQSNIHLTLKFLGEIDDKKIEEVKSSLNQVVKDKKSFQMHLSGIGAFPNLSFARVLWVGIGEGAKECEALQKAIEESMEKIGFAKENRPFSAHLTLGRVRSAKNKEALIKTIEKEKDFAATGKVSVTKLILFQSTLTSRGSIYTALEEFPLL